MAGFNFQPPAAPAQAPNPMSMMPFQLLSPQMLAQIAQAAFRPPGGGMGGGMDMGGGGGAPPPGMNFGGVAQGLGSLADAYVKNRNAANIREGVYPSPSNASYGDLGGPGGTYGQPLTTPDFFNGNASSSLGYGSFGGFGSGAASVSPSFIGGGASGFGGG